MTKQSIAKAWGSKIVASVCAATLAATMVAIPAFGGTEKAYAAADATGYVTCAAYRAAESAPEILGLSGVSTNSAWQSVGVLDWSAPYYYIMGTNLNVNANPYMVNAVENTATGTSNAQPSLVYTQRQGGPMANMYAYGVNADSDAAWNMLPDVILGTGQKTTVDYSDAAYAPAAAAANGVTDYNPIGIKFDSTNIYTMIDTMYNLASAGDQIVAESNGAKQLRYGNATDIAKQFEKYVKGLQGYVLKNASAKKTVALVKNYDAASGTYELVPTGVAEGTATANRYLEAVQNVAVNLGDSQTTATKDDLAGVDLIMLGSQSGKENIASTEDILASFTSDMTAKTYWVNSAHNSAGSCYGVTMNAVENAQNLGRILGCLYPELIDQDNAVCYYYDNFYHITTAGLASTIDNAMDGVRNWDATDGSDLTTWTEADAADYNEASFEALLDEGVAYIQGNNVPSILKMSANYTSDSAAIAGKFTDVNASDYFAAAAGFVSDKGIMKGYSNTRHFGGWNSMTRAEFVTILWRYADPVAAGAYNNDATDTTGLANVESNAYYTAAANWAVANGVIKGVNDTDFAPNDTVTFEQMMTIIARLKGGSAVDSADTSALDKFSDVADVSGYAKQALAWTYAQGYYGGADGKILPQEGVYRGRCAQVLYNGFEKGLL